MGVGVRWGANGTRHTQLPANIAVAAWLGAGRERSLPCGCLSPTWFCRGCRGLSAWDPVRWAAPLAVGGLGRGPVAQAHPQRPTPTCKREYPTCQGTACGCWSWLRPWAWAGPKPARLANTVPMGRYRAHRVPPAPTLIPRAARRVQCVRSPHPTRQPEVGSALLAPHAPVAAWVGRTASGRAQGPWRTGSCGGCS